MPKDAAVEEFAGLVRALKARDGRSYEALGRRLSVSASTLHRYCSGATVPEVFAVVDRLALLYGAYEEEQQAREAAWTRTAPAAERPRPRPRLCPPRRNRTRIRPHRNRAPPPPGPVRRGSVRAGGGCPAPAAPLRGAPSSTSRSPAWRSWTSPAGTRTPSGHHPAEPAVAAWTSWPGTPSPQPSSQTSPSSPTSSATTPA
nr:helix-turn-helix transcriptional regulator [Streptomyces sp. A0592]